MVVRPQHLSDIAARLAAYPVVTVLGPRQVGKSTLARAVAEAAGPYTWFDVENPRDARRLEDPMAALESLTGLVVIDEVQRAPHVFPALRVLADRAPSPARFLLLGSAAPELSRGVSESLAGRVAFHHLPPLALEEFPDRAVLWLRGGFPRSTLAAHDEDSAMWREDFVTTFLDRDLAALGLGLAPAAMRRFWTMLAHWHGQRWNAAELGRAFGVSDKTVRGYLDVLTGTFVVRQLQPWFENVASRQVKAPKVYIADSGLLHTLLGLRTAHDVAGHPVVGASWEGFGISEVMRRLGLRAHECFHWGTHTGAEMDLVVVRGNRRLGFEFKHNSAPARTRAMIEARNTLHLERVDVIYPGDEVFSLGEGIRAVPPERAAWEV